MCASSAHAASTASVSCWLRVMTEQLIPCALCPWHVQPIQLVSSDPVVAHCTGSLSVDNVFLDFIAGFLILRCLALFISRKFLSNVSFLFSIVVYYSTVPFNLKSTRRTLSFNNKQTSSFCFHKTTFDLNKL